MYWNKESLPYKIKGLHIIIIIIITKMYPYLWNMDY